MMLCGKLLLWTQRENSLQAASDDVIPGCENHQQLGTLRAKVSVLRIAP